MNTWVPLLRWLRWMCLGCSVAVGTPAPAASVNFVRVPDGGIQPQAVADARGAVHLVYFKGEPKAGDLFYVRRPPGQMEFSRPLRVNSDPGSAIAVGTIRGAQLALGRNGRVHVVWNGARRRPDAEYKGVPLWYARLNEAGDGFEPQRDLIHSVGELDGGGTVAADAMGNVYALWHGSAPGNPPGEAGRVVYLARSADDGAVFARESRVDAGPPGVCACCGMRALANRSGDLFVMVRAAVSAMNRDERILVSTNLGQTFAAAGSHPWRIAACPMSSAALAAGNGGVFAAWETAGQVFFASVDARAAVVGEPVAPPGTGRRKHPVSAVNSRGELLLAWTEGTGWQKGGAAAWQVFAADGKPTGTKGRLDGAVPVWGLLAAVAESNGDFTVFH